jgi:hypothetical protein
MMMMCVVLVVDEVDMIDDSTRSSSIHYHTLRQIEQSIDLVRIQRMTAAINHLCIVSMEKASVSQQREILATCSGSSAHASRFDIVQ